MQQISEQWQIQVGKNKHIISGEELKMILGAGEARFVRFRDLVINPAFVSDMVLIKRENFNQLEALKEEYVPISRDKFKHFKEEVLSKIGVIRK